LTTEDEANPTFRSAEAVMPSWPCQGADVGRAGVRRSGEMLKAREMGVSAVRRGIGLGPGLLRAGRGRRERSWAGPRSSQLRWALAGRSRTRWL